MYDRLDALAEPCWGGDSCTNGFYLRDDIPAEMAGVLGVGRILSDYAQHCGDSQSLSNGPSQDQAWASFMGLALVQALTDAGVPASSITANYYGDTVQPFAENDKNRVSIIVATGLKDVNLKNMVKKFKTKEVRYRVQ